MKTAGGMLGDQDALGHRAYIGSVHFGETRQLGERSPRDV